MSFFYSSQKSIYTFANKFNYTTLWDPFLLLFVTLTFSLFLFSLLILEEQTILLFHYMTFGFENKTIESFFILPL